MVPGLGAAGPAAAGGAQKRDVIVVHLREVDSDRQLHRAAGRQRDHQARGTTVLLPNALSVSTDDGSHHAGPGRSSTTAPAPPGTRSTPCWAPTSRAPGGSTPRTWRSWSTRRRRHRRHRRHRHRWQRQDPGAAGKGQDLNGQAAVAYATYRAPGEPQDAAARPVRPGHAGRAGEDARATPRRRPRSWTDTGRRSSTPRSPTPQLGATLAPAGRPGQDRPLHDHRAPGAARRHPQRAGHRQRRQETCWAAR